jgi:hypothetical protein
MLITNNNQLNQKQITLNQNQFNMTDKTEKDNQQFYKSQDS